jgi:catechol 2,3-dioxygenase-like lactoylglutathione lyase family enzyme
VAVVTVRRSNTILYSARWEETVAFYRTTLALPVEFENDWFVEFAIGPGVSVSVADAERATIAPGHGAGITLSFQVDDLDELRSELLGAGIDVGRVSRRWGAPVVYLRDPSGNRLEFWARPGGLG